MDIFSFFKRKQPHTTLGGKEILNHQDLFDFIGDLSTRIEGNGNPRVAQEIRDGLRCLNGLTDGWALFMESLEHSISIQGNKFGSRESSDLQELLEYVRKIVYR